MLSVIRRSNTILPNLINQPNLDHNVRRTINTTSCVFAARKGIRIARTRAALARAKQRKTENTEKAPWVNPKYRIDKTLVNVVKKRYTDIGKDELPKDNVFFLDNRKEIAYTIEEALELHREVLDKTVLNSPNALVFAKIEMNLRLKKKTKFIKELYGVHLFPNDYSFKRNNRIVAICKDDEEIEMANKLGVTMAGSKDILKLIKAKELKEVDYDYIICHSDMLLQLAESKKFLGDRFPGTYLNNFGTDMKKLMERFVNGITYKVVPDIIEKDYGYVENHFGRLNMTDEQLKENLLGLLREILKHKPSDTDHPLLTRVLIKAPPNDEEFKIRHWEYLDLEDPFINELKRHEKEMKDLAEEERRKAKRKKKKN